MSDDLVRGACESVGRRGLVDALEVRGQRNSFPCIVQHVGGVLSQARAAVARVGQYACERLARAIVIVRWNAVGPEQRRSVEAVTAAISVVVPAHCVELVGVLLDAADRRLS